METRPERRRRVTHRALPLLCLLGLASLGAGLLVGSRTESGSERIARDFTRLWARGDYAAMHLLLTPEARDRHPLSSFRAAYRRAASTATTTFVSVGDARGVNGDRVAVPVTVGTRVFGTVRSRVELEVEDEAIDWGPELAFPGLRPGEALARRVRAPERAPIISVDGKVLAEGRAEGRSSPLALASSIAGTLAPNADPRVRRGLVARGFAADMPVGSSGLERALQLRLEGVPGGTLLAGSRVLVRSVPRAAPPARSTIDTRLQEVAVSALAGRLGGVAALDTSSGRIRALAGVAFSAPQPPGSTFKIVTTTAALEGRLVKPGDRFAVETRALIDGVELENANGELCGGTFANSFAESCNSVFAPLGVKVGAQRLVDTAERYGWNQGAELPGERPSTLPSAGEIASPLELGSTAIGQGRVLATTLQMASVAQTVANRGVRVLPTLLPARRGRRVRVTSPQVAITLRDLMIGVVAEGTGTAAAIPGVAVAGKTGTAELEDTRGPNVDETLPADPSNTDAWFTAFAPARNPKIAVAVLLVRSGAGGATAAPAARLVLARALGK